MTSDLTTAAIKRPRTVGVISDTHGLLRPEAVAALAGCDLLVHAGDVGDAGILRKLERIAPVTAVRGNVDVEPWAKALPLTEVLDLGPTLLYLLHDLHALDIDPQAAGVGVVVFGHSHRPAAVRQDGILFLTPGSAGPRRFDLPVTLARLTVSQTGVEPEIITLKV